MPNRNSIAAWIASAAVVIAIVLGFWSLGSPSSERQRRQDSDTIRSLAFLAMQINSHWSAGNKTLPQNLDRFSASVTRDPATHAPFRYLPGAGSDYQLCATFITDTRSTAPQGPEGFWAHPQGPYCFHLDATISLPMAPY